jgi:uncharacterized protein DUF4082
MKTTISYVVALIAVAAIATSAQAEFGVKVTGNGSTNNGSWTLGYQFTVGAVPIRVSDLGYFDSDQNGLVSSHQVGLWKMDGTLLTSAIVDNASPLNSFFRWKSISPILLNANTAYKVAGTTGTDDYSWENSGFGVGAGITYNSDAYVAGSFAFPASTDMRTPANPAYFGGNIAYTLVPECSTLGLTALALWSLGFRRSYGSPRPPCRTIAGL